LTSKEALATTATIDDNEQRSGTKIFLLRFSPIVGDEALVLMFTCEMALMRLGFFFLLILLLRFQKIIGHVSFDSSASCGYPLFFLPQAWQSVLSFFAFCFCVYHSPYYILIILAFFLLYNTFYYYSVLAAILSLFMLFGLRVRLDIQPRRKNCWLLDMEAGFKISGFNFFLFPAPPNLFSMLVNWGCFRFFGFSVSFGSIPP